MKDEDNYIVINRNSWNKKTEIHINSEFYDMEGFLKGKSSLNKIELDLLGDVQNKTILHLQCHFGQDTISLSRMGAISTGVDFSNKAIDNARKIARQCQTDTQFICCDIYDLVNHLDHKFDIVFTSYGTIGWLPDLDKWAKIITHFLKPGGKFVFAEFHPYIWMYDDFFKSIKYDYFKSEAIIETESGTYADKKAAIKQKYISWNHSLSEVLGSLLKNGMELRSFEEFDYSPYNCFNNTLKVSENKYTIKTFGNKIPIVYSLSAIKKLNT